MDYMTALLMWIAQGQTEAQVRPHCLQLVEMVTTAKGRGENLWKACYRSENCNMASDMADDNLEELCPDPNQPE